MGLNMKYVEMEGRNIKAVYIRSDPSRRAACGQLVGIPMVGQDKKVSQVYRTMHMMPISNY